jgi:hypothetical protein
MRTRSLQKAAFSLGADLAQILRSRGGLGCPRGQLPGSSLAPPAATHLPFSGPPTDNGGYAEPLTPEQQHQAFLSRLLLMLGSFVIMVSRAACTGRALHRLCRVVHLALRLCVLAPALLGLPC